LGGIGINWRILKQISNKQDMQGTTPLFWSMVGITVGFFVTKEIKRRVEFKEWEFLEKPRD
jgi:hypothetical protein